MSTSPEPPDALRALTDQDVQRIAAEERLRTRLRSEFDLKPKQESRSSWWAFLNSPFGLFLLSSVVLAGLTGLYTQIQYYSRQLEVRNQEILKITTELKYRLEQVKHFSAEMKLDAPENKINASRFIWYTVRGGPENYRASLPEFSGTTTYGLVSRLRLLGVTAGTEAALNAVLGLEDGQTESDGHGQVIYPQGFLDSQVRTLSDYADGVLVPYLDKQRNRSLIKQLLF